MSSVFDKTKLSLFLSKNLLNLFFNYKFQMIVLVNVGKNIPKKRLNRINRWRGMGDLIHDSFDFFACLSPICHSHYLIQFF